MACVVCYYEEPSLAAIPLVGALGLSALLGSMLGALVYARSRAPKPVRLRHASGAFQRS